MVGRNEDYETIFDMKVEDIKESVHTTRINLGKMKHFQFMQSADMSRVGIYYSFLTHDLINTPGHPPCQLKHGDHQLLVPGAPGHDGLSGVHTGACCNRACHDMKKSILI